MSSKRINKKQIRIISEVAGVMPETVKAAFENGGRISGSLKRRILEVAATQGVAAPPKKQQAKRARHPVMPPLQNRGIALLWDVELSESSYHSLLLKHICLEAVERNLTIALNPIVGPVDESIDRLNPYAGMITAGFSVGHMTLLKGLHVPVITFSCDLDWTADISVDSRRAVELAVLHLVKNGHRKIGYLSPKLGRPVSSIRWDAFNQVMQGAGLKISPDHVSITDFLPGNALKAYELLGEYLMVKVWGQENRPTALVCYNDSMALGVVRYCHQNGVRIPEDLSLVSIDDIPEAATACPALTTVSVKLPEMGRRAVGMMHQFLESGQFVPEKRYTIPELVVRQSVRKIA